MTETDSFWFRALGLDSDFWFLVSHFELGALGVLGGSPAFFV
jgi:hypothetical protein